MLKSYSTQKVICGCDEAGRGCLAGPVFAAAVILPKDFKHYLLDDSKKINKKSRETLRKIIEKEALYWSVSKVSERQIEKYNILNSSIQAMHLSIKKIQTDIDLIIVDGNKFKKYKKIPHKCIIKGDQKYNSIAAASILAKTHRDDFMMSLHLRLPEYKWHENKGYPTKKHKEAIKQFGISSFHRKTFNYK